MTLETLVINLNRNPERLLFMQKQLGDAGISFTRQEAIDGKIYDFSPDFDESEYRKVNKGFGISLGERGCALSHKKALEKMLTSPSDYALIMEDDVSIPKNFKSILDHEIKRHQDGETSWEYLSFNYPSVGYKAIILWLFLFYTMFTSKKGSTKYLTLPIYLIKFLAVATLSMFEGFRESLYRRIYKTGKPGRFLRPLYLAGCYLVTRDGAHKLLKTQGDKIRYTADRLPNVARVKEGLRFFGFVPLLVIQQRDIFQSNSVDPEFDEKVKKFMGGRLLRE